MPMQWIFGQSAIGRKHSFTCLALTALAAAVLAAWLVSVFGNQERTVVAKGLPFSYSVNPLHCDLIPYDLTVEHLSASHKDLPTINPNSDRAPRFSFKALSSTTPSPEAAASHIQIIRPKKGLNSSEGGKEEDTIWDSGWIRAGRSNGLDITRDRQLDALVPMERLIWRARFGVEKENSTTRISACPWSSFEPFLVGPSDEQWEQADWICAPDRMETDCDFYDTSGKAAAPIFRTEFQLPFPWASSGSQSSLIASARLFVTGLGHYEAWMNGIHINQGRYLDPAPSSYDRRIYYNSFDVTNLMMESNTTKHVLGFLVGNGWFNPLPMKFWGRRNLREALTVGTPRVRCILSIEYQDASLKPLQIMTRLPPSGSALETWETTDSALLRNDLYLGNIVDLDRANWLEGWSQVEMDNPMVMWQPVESCLASSESTLVAAVLEPQPIPPIRSRRPHKLHPVSTTAIGNDMILDMGLNTATVVQVDLFVPQDWVCRAQQIELKFGEMLFPNGTVNVYTSVAGQIKDAGCCGPCAPALAYQRLILRTTRSGQYTTQFSWSGFRYVQISSLPPGWGINVTAIPLMTDIKWTGSFQSSNALLNDIFELCRNTHASNMVGIQSDCPHRERFGYTGDAFATLPTSLALFDGAAFYEKRLYDVQDSLRVNGGVTETAPFVGIASNGLGDGSGPIGWQSFLANVQLELNRYFANTRIIPEMRNDTRRWIELLLNRTDEIEHGLGDWMALDKMPLAVSGRIFLVEALRAWELLSGSKEEKRITRARTQYEVEEFRRRFLSESNGDISVDGSPPTQGGQALALHYKMIPGKDIPLVAQSMMRTVKASKNHITTGMFGIIPLFETLTAANRTDLAWDVVTKTTYPSYGHMLRNNATTIWESWSYSNNTFSHNHPMFSGVAAWMMWYIGGVRISKHSIGSDRIVFAPNPPATSKLRHASTILHTVRGVASCKWKCQSDGAMAFEIICPANARGLVLLPDGSNPTMIKGGKYNFRAQSMLCQSKASAFQEEKASYLMSTTHQST